MAESGNFDNNATESVLDDDFPSKLSPTGDLVFSIVQLFFCTQFELLQGIIANSAEGCLIVICLILGSFSVIGNSCILILFSCRRSKLNPVEILLLNLGIVDLLLAVASYPMSTISGFYHRWIFGLNGCYFYAFTCYFLGLTGIFTIAAIAVLRFVTTCNIASSSYHITRKTSWQIMFACYSSAFMWALLPLAQIGEYSFEPFGLSCTLNWLAISTGSQVYISFVSFFCVAVPTLLIFFSYVAIILTVRQTNALMGNGGVQRKRCELQLTLATGLVSGGFIFAWFPYTAVSLYTTFVTKQVVLPMWATPIPVVMAKSSIVYNPLIYLFFPVSYRKEFFKIVSSWWDNALNRNAGSTSKNNLKTNQKNIKFGFEAFLNTSSKQTTSVQHHIRSDTGSF